MNPTSNAALYGKGVFTTVAIIGGEPFLWDDHWRRLTAHADRLSIILGDYTEKIVLNELSSKLKTRKVNRGRARITFFDTSTASIAENTGPRATELQVTVGESRVVSESFKIGLSPFTFNSASPLVGIKSCNYLEHLLAYQQARASGLDEAIRLNEHGLITSGSMANVFWMIDGELRTPHLDSGCVAGTTRELILRSVDCVEVLTDIGEIETAERIFFTSAGMGIRSIAEFNGRPFDTSYHPILDLWPK